jgi:PAS domain S-box-containing protein
MLSGGMEARGSDVEARLAAQYALTRKLLTADTVEEAAPAYLSSVGTLLGWDAAALWEIPEHDRMLHLVQGWHAETLDSDALWAESRKLRMGRGTGLPGRAWESGEVVWVHELDEEVSLPRRELFTELGLSMALAIPVPIGPPDEVLGVAEFYATEPAALDDELMSLLLGFTDQLAMFMKRRRVEKALRESEALKSAMLGSAYDCVIGMNHIGVVIEFNEAAEQTFGYTREEAVGQDLAQLVVPPELRDRHRQGLSRYLATGQTRILNERVELTAMRRDGSTFPIELAVTRLPGSDPPIFTGYVRDISDRIEAERIRAHLAAVVQGTSDAVASKDLDGVITAWNDGAVRLYGYTAEEAIGQPIYIIVPPGREEEEANILERIRKGERVEPYETTRVRKDGAHIDVSLTVSPITDPILGIVGASHVARDITADRRRRTAQEFVSRAAAALEASLDLDEIARTIVETAVPDLAELCIIDFIGEDGTIGRPTVAAADPVIAAELESLRRNHPLDRQGGHPVARVLRTGRSLVLHDLKQPRVQEEIAQSDAHRNFMARADYNSAAVAPMYARGRLVGAISFLHVGNDRRFDEEDLALIEDLAARSAMALDNARLYRDRDHIAKVLQRGLRPDEPQPIPGIELSVVFEAAGEGVELGGDFYDVIPVDGSHYVLVGDVAGHGAEVAAYTAQIRHTVRALALFSTSPADIVQRVNTVLLETETGQRFATLQLARIETRDDGVIDVELASAAHPPAVIVRGNGSTQTLSGGAIVGVWQEVEVAVHRAPIEPGETLLLYTDGWLEAGPVARHRTPEELASELAAVADDDLDAVLDRLRADAVTRGGSELRDDLVLLGLRPTGSREPAAAA